MVAAINLRAEFFAPSTVTSPVTEWPPTTFMTSINLRKRQCENFTPQPLASEVDYTSLSFLRSRHDDYRLLEEKASGQ